MGLWKLGRRQTTGAVKCSGGEKVVRLSLINEHLKTLWRPVTFKRPKFDDTMKRERQGRKRIKERGGVTDCLPTLLDLTLAREQDQGR